MVNPSIVIPLPVTRKRITAVCNITSVLGYPFNVTLALFTKLNVIGATLTCISAKPTISPVFISESPSKSSPCDVTIEKVTPLDPIDDWVATHQLTKYLPSLFILLLPFLNYKL